MDDLKGKNVIVFGATKGIGAQVALDYAKNGCNVGIFGRSSDKLKDVENQIKKTSSNIYSLNGDVSKEDDIKDFISNFIHKFGAIDIAYNNAGAMGSFSSEDDLNKDLYEEIFSTNVFGMILCLKYELKQMLKQKKGVIINCASVGGIIGHKGNPVYSASKHAVCGLTKSLALRYAKSNIRINAIAPGSTATDMLLNLYDSEEKATQRKNSIPLARFALVEEISNAILFLSSEKSSFMTGHIMAVDGGVTAGRS
ncbi:MAG: glucose 1-dehydrogenase [Alphaproteobacteria bacterium]|jgi:NAD(P)-dependent dehydrogenase (short-subunit alcohol dehydrogenase family)|nr:glucose 1-dehydrogenase [Alphaproteobacteria bacterium]